VPHAVLEARQKHQNYLDLLEMVNSIQTIPVPKIRLDNEDAPDDPIAIEGVVRE
jgi:hypothetical protein